MPVPLYIHTLLTATLITVASAAIVPRTVLGPYANLDIVNKYISPDGYNRSYVTSSVSVAFLLTSIPVLFWQVVPSPGPSS